MKLLFVKSGRPGSRIIQWALKEDCSHFAVCFDEEANGSGIAFHSISSGATLEWFGLFRKTHTIVHALSFKTPLSLPEEEAVYQSMLAQYSGQGYDYKALAFWTWRGALWRFFGRSLPAKNDWAVNGYNLCTGLAGGIEWVRSWAEANGIDLEMIGPEDLYSRLKATGNFKDEADWCALQASP